MQNNLSLHSFSNYKINPFDLNNFEPQYNTDFKNFLKFIENESNKNCEEKSVNSFLATYLNKHLNSKIVNIYYKGQDWMVFIKNKKEPEKTYSFHESNLTSALTMAILTMLENSQINIFKGKY